MTTREHGTLARYKSGCRCFLCRVASARYESRRQRLAAYGRPTTDLVDAEPVRAYVRALRAQYVGYRRVAELAGVSPRTLHHVLYGRSKRVRSRIADAVLAVKPIPDLKAQVDVTGTRRRLQALIAVGWTQRQLADRLGCTPSHLAYIVGGRQPMVEYRRALATRELYDELWDETPQGRSASINRAKNHGARRGWAPPAAWDDETIDDPNAQPQFGEPELRRRVHLDEVDHLRRFGMSDREIAAILGVKVHTIQDVERRSRKGAA